MLIAGKTNLVPTSTGLWGELTQTGLHLPLRSRLTLSFFPLLPTQVLNFLFSCKD